MTDFTTNEGRAKHAASLGYDLENYDQMNAYYERVRDDFLNEGLRDLLPADFDKECLNIAPGAPVAALYTPTMTSFERRQDGSWFIFPKETA